MAAVLIGGYSLKTKFIVSLFTVFALLVHGASDVGTDRVSVIVMEGDSVKLHTNITINQQDIIRWYFNKTLIALINLTQICTDVQCNKGTERFRDRLELDNQTGSLTIMNTTASDNGVYHLKIFSNSSSSEMVFEVDVREVAEIKGKLGKEGESVTLDSPEEKQNNDVITWYLNDIVIAEITGDQSKICTDDQCDERFRDRLKLDHQTGSLTITNTRTTDSGLYTLQIYSSDSRFSITREKRFSVTVTDSAVPDSGLSSAVVAVICVGVAGVLLVAAAAVGVIYCLRGSSKKGSPHDRSGSQHRAGANAEHSCFLPPQTGCCTSPFQSLADSESETE